MSMSLLERLQFCRHWLKYLLSQVLAQVCRTPDVNLGGRRLLLRNATHLNRNGTTCVDTRLHISYNLLNARFDGIKLTDSSESGSFGRLESRSKDILIGDRGYTRRSSIAEAMASGADVISRICWRYFSVKSEDLSRFDILRSVQALDDEQLGDWNVVLEHVGEHIHGRVIAVRKSELDALCDERRMRRKAAIRQHRTTELAVELNRYFFIFTTLDSQETPASMILDLYQSHWQIEMFFKRLKSIIKLSDLPACTDELAETIVFGRLLAAALILRLSSESGFFR